VILPPAAPLELAPKTGAAAADQRGEPLHREIRPAGVDGKRLVVRGLRDLVVVLEQEANLDRNLSLDRLARVAGMSASHLKTLFRRATGVPLHRYVIQRRVQRARTLLEQGDLSTSQVALEAGFAHQSHLARWMRRLLGVTPTAIARVPRPRLVRSA
jgi:AraC-like DNA-binding protein